MQAYRRRFGWRATLARLLREVRGLGPAAPAALPGPVAAAVQPSVPADLVRQRFPLLAPLRFFRAPSRGRPRVTMIADSISRGHLFGGVGTAMILAVLLANRKQADLRLITRTEPPAASDFAHVLAVYGLALQGESQFRFSPVDHPNVEHDLYEDELLITTSWWGTASTLASVSPHQVAYLLQEDERMFYPYGDERLRCENLLRRQDLRFVVNTELLRRHFISEGLTHFETQALSFEPAFPERVFHPRRQADGNRRRFVFYARPHNARNLFLLGLEVVDQALREGVLDPRQWEIVFVGRDIPDLILADAVRPARYENLAWARYADLVGSCDLGFSLMYTPHPSYPPLDMVASGAVVVSTRQGLKQDLSALSRNLILCDPDRDALLAGLREGAALAADEPRRQAQYRASTLSRDWEKSLQPVVDQLAARP